MPSNQFGDILAIAPTEGQLPIYRENGSGLLYYRQPNGSKTYLPPNGIAKSDGGLFQNSGTFNDQTGQYDPGGVDKFGMGVWGALAAGAGNAFAPAVAGGGSALGPSTSANMAATSTAASSVPASLSAGGTAGVASKGIASWILPALGIGGNLLGAAVQANASDKASERNAQSLADALAFEKNQYADLTGRLSPFVSNGASASDRQAQLLGLPARSGSTATTSQNWGPSSQPVNQFGSSTRGPETPQPKTASATVTIKTPDGRKLSGFPAEKLQEALQRGATQVAA